jgi:hypothetical protein
MKRFGFINNFKQLLLLAELDQFKAFMSFNNPKRTPRIRVSFKGNIGRKIKRRESRSTNVSRN